MSFFLAGCHDKLVTALPSPPERLVCEYPGARPALPSEDATDWTTVGTIDEARAAHQRYVTSVRNREGIVTGYILATEGKLFVCANNMEWRRQYESRLPRP